MTVSLNWVGEGKEPLLRHAPDGDILAHVINVFQQREDFKLRSFSSRTELTENSSFTRRLTDGRPRDEMLAIM